MDAPGPQKNEIVLCALFGACLREGEKNTVRAPRQASSLAGLRFHMVSDPALESAGL